MESPKANFSQQCWIQKIPGGGAAVSNALRTTCSTCLPVLVIHSVANLVIDSANTPEKISSDGKFLGRNFAIEANQGELDGADF